jgi:hypothetical protein
MEDLAMNTHCLKLSPAESPPQAQDRFRLIADWWSELRTGEDSGATTWEVLDLLERQVTECLMHDPPDLSGAESITAKAALLLNGGFDD